MNTEHSSAARPRFCLHRRLLPAAGAGAVLGGPASRPSRSPVTPAARQAQRASVRRDGRNLDRRRHDRPDQRHPGKLRCRANYTYGAEQQQSCAGHPLRQRQLQVRTDQQRGRARRPDFRHNGTRPPTSVSGSITGRVNGGRISAVARATASPRRWRSPPRQPQSVTITPKATYIISVQISLSRCRIQPPPTASGAEAARQERSAGQRLCAARRSRRARGAIPTASGPSPSRQRRGRRPCRPVRARRPPTPTPLAPTACAAPLSLCAAAASAARLPLREALSISRWVSTAVSRNLPQQRVDRGLVVAEPGAEHAAVDRAAGFAPLLAVAWPLPLRSTESQRSSVVRSRSMFTGLTR